MIPKQLFITKRMHPGRARIFKEDLTNLSNLIFKDLNLHDRFAYEDSIIKFNYQKYKQFYAELKFSMIHNIRDNKEIREEYYQILYGVIQKFFFDPEYRNHDLFYKLFAIYSLYSIYFTQNSPVFTKITINVEFLDKVNELIMRLRYSKNEGLKRISFEVYHMIKKLKENEAFIIGIVPGLKTIFLNKHKLPIEEKDKYKDFKDLLEFDPNEFENQEDKFFDSAMEKYERSKIEAKNEIRNCDFDKEEYLQQPCCMIEQPNTGFEIKFKNEFLFTDF